MLNICAQVVGWCGDTLGKVRSLCAVSTAQVLCALGVPGFEHSLCSFCAHLCGSFPQKTLHLSPPYFLKLYPFSTGPINTTNLIKE
jgi:hypothetical protein